MHILLTRHGQVEGIQPERFRGRKDLALTGLGRRQAQALAHRVATESTPQAIYTSPLRRSRETAAEIAAACGLGVQTMESLVDLDYGEWQWRTHDEVRLTHPHDYALWESAPQWLRFPRGESLQDVALRVADGLRGLLHRHADHTVVLVGHDSVNRVLLLHALGLPLSAYWRIAQSPGCLNRIDVTLRGGAAVLLLNDIMHLRELAP